MSAEEEFEALLAQMRAGSDEAVRELFRRYGGTLLRVVRYRLGQSLRRSYDSQDFVQAAWASFLALPTAGQTFKNPKEMLAFLAAIARNKVTEAARQRTTRKYDMRREETMTPQQLDELPGPDPRASQLILAEDEWETLLAAARPHQRHILLLLRQGKTQREIAAQLGVDQRTIRRLLQRLRPSGPDHAS